MFENRTRKHHQTTMKIGNTNMTRKTSCHCVHTVVKTTFYDSAFWLTTVFSSLCILYTVVYIEGEGKDNLFSIRGPLGCVWWVGGATE